MYKSPLEIISSFTNDTAYKIKTETDNLIMEAVYNVGVNVDKAELIKALEYDRDQYEKGYRDGKRDNLAGLLAEVTNAFETAGLENKTKRIEQVERYANEDISIMFDHDLHTAFVYDKDQNATVEIQPEELKAMYLYCLSVGWIDTQETHKD